MTLSYLQLSKNSQNQIPKEWKYAQSSAKQGEFYRLGLGLSPVKAKS